MAVVDDDVAFVESSLYRASNPAPAVRTLSTSSALTVTFLPSASVARNVESAAEIPGAEGRFGGSVVRPSEPSVDLMDATNALYASMPASLTVAPSSFLPKIATTRSSSSSQTLWYSGYLPVVFAVERATVAVSFTTSVASIAQPLRFGR